LLRGESPFVRGHARAQARVSPQMDLYCPFTLPKGFGRTGV